MARAIIFALREADTGVAVPELCRKMGVSEATYYPVLMGLFSIVTLMADSLQKQGKLNNQVSSWYTKPQPTFNDALACVRGYLWRETNFHMSSNEVVHVKMSQQQFLLRQNALAWAA